MPTNDLAWVGFSVETGPDGGVYILDWHDQNICGNVVKFANSARVYRIMPKGVKPIKSFDLNKLSDEELTDMQDHSNDWYVRQARTVLQYRAASGKLNSAKVHGKVGNHVEECQDRGQAFAGLVGSSRNGWIQGQGCQAHGLARRFRTIRPGLDHSIS